MSQSKESFKHKFAKDTLVSWLRSLAEGNVDKYVELAPISWRVNRGARPKALRCERV